MFTSVPAQHFAGEICCLLNNATPVESLENEMQALKIRCNMLERTVKELQSICDTHQRTLESHRQYIIKLQEHHGTLEYSYEGVDFGAMP